MSNLRKLFLSMKNFSFESGVSLDEIARKEESLQLKFSEEYKNYLMEFGVVSFDGHELTGITHASTWLDVEEATILCREINPNVQPNMYVIEDAHIDEIMYLQDETGNVYFTSLCNKPELVFESLHDYIASLSDDTANIE